jgi:DNA-directed RNA polymerase specialized sigma24 family protein
VRAVDAIYDYYADDLYDYCLTFVDPETAADALHDALLVAVAWHNHLEARDQFGLWLYALTRNECLRALRRGQSAAGAHSQDGAVSRKYPTDTAKAVLREVHHLVHAHAFDAKEIATLLGVSGGRARALCARSDRLFGRRSAPLHGQPRAQLPPELRARVLASAQVPSRVAYRGDLAAPRQRTGYPVQLDRIEAFRRRRTIRTAGIAAAVLAVVGAAFMVPTNSRQNVVGLLNSSRPASDVTDPLGDLTGSPKPDPSRSAGTPRWSPVPSDGRTDAATGPISGVGGKCVEVADSVGANGSLIQIMQCAQTSAQRWTIPTDGTIRAFNKCLHVHDGGTADGTEIELQPCNGSPAQQWSYRPDGSLRNPKSKRCLEAPTLNASDATKLVLWTCTKTDNQYWQLPS